MLLATEDSEKRAIILNLMHKKGRLNAKVDSHDILEFIHCEPRFSCTDYLILTSKASLFAGSVTSVQDVGPDLRWQHWKGSTYEGSEFRHGRTVAEPAFSISFFACFSESISPQFSTEEVHPQIVCPTECRFELDKPMLTKKIEHRWILSIGDCQKRRRRCV